MHGGLWAGYMKSFMTGVICDSPYDCTLLFYFLPNTIHRETLVSYGLVVP